MGVVETDQAVITYETLFELLRMEKSREDLQRLDYNFLEEVSKYVKEKKMLLKRQPTLDTFSSDQKEKTERQLHNIRSILGQLYDRREKKMIQMAMNKARLGLLLSDISNLLPPERKMFDELVATLESYRREILFNVLNPKEEYAEHGHVETPAPKLETNAGLKPVEETKPAPQIDSDTKMIRFTASVPKFVGLDMEIYGPFMEDDVANLPKEIADVLVQKGRAEELGKGVSEASEGLTEGKAF